MTWKAIKGLEGYYEISDDGEVRSLTRTLTLKDGRVRTFIGKTLKQQSDKDGYLLVTLYRDGPVYGKVSRLVAEAFIENPHRFAEVDHRNGVKTDNRVSNLRWASKSLNGRNRHKTRAASGIIGVRYREGKLNPWQAYCYAEERRFKSLGHFATALEAKAVREKFQEQYA